MSAVSKMLTPASRQRPMRRLASSTPVDPQALKNSVPPPKVPVPKQSAETLSPQFPSSLYSIERLLVCNPFRRSRPAPHAKLSPRSRFNGTSARLTGQLFRARSGARLAGFTAGCPNISLGIVEGGAFGLPPSNYTASSEWPLIRRDYRALFLPISAVVI